MWIDTFIDATTHIFGPRLKAQYIRSLNNPPYCFLNVSGDQYSGSLPLLPEMMCPSWGQHLCACLGQCVRCCRDGQLVFVPGEQFGRLRGVGCLSSLLDHAGEAVCHLNPQKTLNVSCVLEQFKPCHCSHICMSQSCFLADFFFLFCVRVCVFSFAA